MSKITAKNLSYSSAPPPFLAALQAQASGQAGPDPIISGRKRGAKKRSASEEAEDEPLVVDENGNVVSLDGGGGDDKDPQEGEATHAKAEDGKDDRNEGKSMIGGRRKKVGKVVGQSSLSYDEDDTASKKASSVDKPDADPPAPKKPTKKKAKKIKLSFDDQDEI